MSRAIRVLTAMVVVGALSAVVANGVAAKPAGPGPGNKAGAKACQKGGWDELYRSASDGGTGFNSEQECTSYAAQGGTLSTTPPPTPTAQSVCEAAGGTGAYGGETPDSYFTCTADTTDEQLQALNGFCEAQGGFAFIVGGAGPDFYDCRKVGGED